MRRTKNNIPGGTKATGAPVAEQLKAQLRQSTAAKVMRMGRRS